MKANPELVLNRLDKAMANIERTKQSIQSGNLLGAKGDIHFIIENAQEALYLLEAEIEVSKGEE